MLFEFFEPLDVFKVRLDEIGKVLTVPGIAGIKYFITRAQFIVYGSRNLERLPFPIAFDISLTILLNKQSNFIKTEKIYVLVQLNFALNPIEPSLMLIKSISLQDLFASAQ